MTPEQQAAIDRAKAKLQGGDLQELQRQAIERARIRVQIENDPISRGAREGQKPQGAMETAGEWFYGNPEATGAQRIAANPLVRTAVGAGDLIMGPWQAGNNVVADVSNKLIGALGGEPNIPRSPFDEKLQTYDQMRQAGGATGFDAMRMLGNFASPVSLGMMKIAPSATAMGRIGQGAAIGGGTAAAMPVTNGAENFYTDKAKQIGVGAALGGGIAGGVEAGRAGARLINKVLEPTYASGREAILNRYQQQLAGDKRAMMAAQLRNAPEIVPGSRPTAGEALSDIPEATALAAHQKALSKSDPVSGLFNRRTTDQQNARAALIKQGAGTDKSLDDAIQLRETNATEGYGPIMARKINPQSSEQIMQDAISGRYASRADALQNQGRFQTDAVQQANAAHGGAFPSGNLSPSAYPVPGYPRVPGRYTQNIDRAGEASSAAREMDGIIQQRVKEESFLNGVLENLRNTVGLGKKSLDDFTSRPSFRAALAEAEQSALEAGRSFPSKPGDKFTVQDMQAVKEFLDESIKKKVGLGLTEADRSIRDISNTRNEFVKWLSEKVPEWKNARIQYAEDSIPINQMKVMRELGKRLTDAGGKETPTTFLRAIDDRTDEAAARLLKKSTGFTRYDNLPQAIGPKNAAAVDAVADDLKRTLAYERNATATNMGNPSGIAERSEGSLPNLLSRPAMIANWFMKKLGEGADEKIVKLAAARYLDPKELAKALEGATNASRGARLAEIMRQGGMAATIGSSSATAQGVQQ